MSTPENADCGNLPNPGAISWVELTTSDPAAAIEYYTRLFGWTTQPFAEGGGDYTMFLHEGRPFGGVLKSPVPEVPTHWKSYVVVADIDDSIEQSILLGGSLCWGPEEVPMVGRIAIVQDAAGAVIGLHELKA